jgi:hypothetical protein
MRSLGYGMVLLALSACDVDEPCDEGQRSERGACVAEGEAMAGSGGGGNDSDKDATVPRADAGEGSALEDGGSTGQACEEDRATSLGADCTGDADCNCAAPYCAKMPGQAAGTCTVFCAPDPDDCPDGYDCFDLSAIGVPGYEPFCIAE